MDTTWTYLPLRFIHSFIHSHGMYVAGMAGMYVCMYYVCTMYCQQPTDGRCQSSRLAELKLAGVSVLLVLYLALHTYAYTYESGRTQQQQQHSPLNRKESQPA